MSRVRQHFHVWVTGLAVLFLGCVFVLFAPQSAFAASTRTWDGEGTDGTCGGGAGDGNKWSCAANWSANTAPIAGDTATFNATSTKNATIDIAFSILTLNMNTGYTGTITQAADLTFSTAGNFTHNTTDGRFLWSAGTLSFTGASSTWNVDTGDDSFGNVTINKTTVNNVTVTPGDTITVTGTLTLTDGNINNGVIDAQGLIIHGADFDGGISTLSITGTDARTIDLTAGGQLPTTVTLNAANVIMNGPTSGTVAFDGAFNVSSGTYTGGAGHITLVGALTISGGTFSSGAGNITEVGTFSVTGGTFTGGAGSIDTNGSFVLSSPGAFTSTSGTFYVADAWTHTDASVFAHNSGTVVFDGAVSNPTINVNTAETFYNLTFFSGANKTVSSGDTLIVEGTYTMVDGNIQGGTVEARGPVIHNALFDGGGGALSITGSAVRTIDLVVGGQLPGVTLNAANVTMNGPTSGTVAFDGGFTVSAGTYTGGAGNITLSSGSAGALTVYGGIFTGGAGDISVATNLTVSGGTFTGGSGMIDVNGAFSLSSPGSFTSTSGTLYAATTWTHTDASVFTHNSGTVVLDGSASNPTINVNTTETFYNLNFFSGANKTISSGDTLIVEGTLTLTDGNIVGGTVEARGPVIHGALFDGGAGTLNITAGSTDINLTAGGQLPP